ncbi:ABC transporter ATP-binding protein [Candidatus Cyrtobacter comes]|uniref:ABC transporter ATP-binding protein n=1 Tax=Candidatus Cyrtobacter comes TaxID=675776 RepID=A0ABU5L966_9RICK|nr:ABC transporter ATP-binding protein [Candidatus Cyrtobacter comes]MDZ5762660.1 ABC transporter ATP-binding protein [Candidatus Cyrtobacter comes]
MLLELKSVSKSFLNYCVIRDVNIVIEPYTCIAVLGRSGSGKSTILHIMSLMEKPTSGKVILSDLDCSALSESKLSSIRRGNVGFLHQYHYLLPDLSTRENIELAQHITGNYSVNIDSLLHELGIYEQSNKFPSSLSGGQSQRVAFARAIASSPKIIFADEPTGSLDRENSTIVFKMIIKGVREKRYSAVIATHDESIIDMVDVCYYVENGRIHART